MTYRGDYDASGFDPADQATWPGWTGTDATYADGDWWYVTGPAVVPAQGGGLIPSTTVEMGDRLYPVGFGRLVGDGTYGGGVFGGPLQSPWTLSDGATVLFRPWSAAAAPWDRPAPPHAGCPYGPSADRWRVVVEALVLDPVTMPRTYGADQYGDGIYGDTLDTAAEVWFDITPPALALFVRRGTADGGATVPADELVVDVFDPAVDWFPFAIPASWYAPSVGSFVRVSLLDPLQSSHPMFVGRIERIDDDHDAPPRVVLVEAFGLTFDTAHTLDTWTRPAELAADRVEALRVAAGWDWSPTVITPNDGPMLQSVDRIDVGVRRELDRTAMSAGWVADFTLVGEMRLRQWPRVESGTAGRLSVSDCPATGDELHASRLRIVDDTAETVNWATYRNAPPVGESASVGHASDPVSIARVGRRPGLGMPFTDLSTMPADLQALADRVVDRYGKVTLRIAEVEVDTLREPRWLAVAADLDTGALVTVTRRAFADRVIELVGIVTGVEHRLQPNRLQSILYLTTLTH